MADPSALSSIPPGVDPSDWIKTQRQLSLSQALQNMALTPVQNDLQQPQGGGKYYQAARVGKVAALSKLADALMANKGFTGQVLPGVGDPGTGGALGAMGRQYSQAQQAFQPGGQIQPTGQTAITAGPQGDAAGPVPAPRTPVYAQTPQNPRNPQGLPPDVMLRLYQSDPAKYAAMVAGPENVQTGQFAGMSRQDAAQAVFNKQNAIDLRSGGMVRLPNGQMIRAPNLPPGYEPEFDAQGNLSGTHPSPGLIPGEAQREGAVTAARNANTLETVPTQAGGSRVGWGGDVLGPPPAARPAPPSNGPAPAPQGPPAAAAAPPSSKPNYFPTQGPPPPAAPAAPAGPDPFPDAPKAPTYSGLGAPSSQDAVLQKARAEHQVSLYQKYGGESDLADATLSRIGEAQKALAGSNAGPLSAGMTHFQGILHQLVPSVFSGDAATNSQIANKNMVTIALNGAKGIYGPRMTSSEVMLQKNEASPSTEQTREAASYLLKQQAIIAQYNKQRSNDYQSYIQAGHDPLRFEGYYSANHGLQQFALQHDPERQSQLAKDRGMTIPPAAFDKLNQNKQLTPFFQQKYGYIPDGF